MITPSFALTATERILPKLALDFTTASLDSRVTFTRALNTATRINSSGLIETINANLPRFDYDPITLICKGLLIEEQRTNLLQSTTAFNNVVYGWYNNSGFYSTVTLNNTTGVDGALSGAKLAATATASNFLRNQSSGQSNNTVDTLSLYMKKGNINFGVLRNLAISGAPYAWFNLNNGTVGTVQAGLTATITNAGNGWYRCSITGTTLASIVNNFIDIVPAATDNSQTVSIGDYIYIDRPQLENGAFPTSQIPTVASQLTRNADVATMTGTNFSNWYNSTQGAIEVQYDIIGLTKTFGMATQIDDGTLNNRIVNIGQEFQSPNVASGSFITTSGSAQMGIYPNTNLAINTLYQNCISYQSNNCANAVNTVILTDNTVNIPTVNTLRIGSRISDGYLNGHIAKINYWPQRISDAETQAFTK
jgi:hypothetical protein